MTKIPPTAVGGCFQIPSTTQPPAISRNPTNGSWWMLSDPFYNAAACHFPQSHQRQSVDRSDPFYARALAAIAVDRAWHGDPFVERI